MSAIRDYQRNLEGVLNRAFDGQREVLEDTAKRMYKCLDGGGMIYLFGTGHAHLLAEELFYRAGGLAGIYPILDEKLMLHISASESTSWERETGYALSLLKQYPVKAGDMVIIASNSGRNAAPVEMARAFREAGAYVVALTNVTHSRAVTPNNPYQAKLMDEADIVIDNCGCVGDAALLVGDRHMGATSTAVGAALLQALSCRAAELALAAGRPLDGFVSSNVEGGDERNEAVIKKYKPLVHCL